jgi:glycosyltransferase involved in cell wall biosynthesis
LKLSDRKPNVSIGFPVYNGARFLEQALDSLLGQTYADFELIICDNASTDNTEEICRSYAAKDFRVKYFRNGTNVGVGRNFNRVFKLSSGEYFKWASADDICEKELLALCKDVLDHDRGVVLAHSKTRFIDDRGSILDINDPGWNLQSELADERLRYVIHAGHWVNPHYGLIRSAALAKTRLMPSYPGGDYRLLAELSLKGKFVEIPEYHFFRRVHAGASSQNTGKVMWTMEFHRGTADRVCLPFWNLSVDHVLTIMTSGLNIRQKVSLFAFVLRVMWWQHKRLSQELRISLASYCNRVGIRKLRR